MYSENYSRQTALASAHRARDPQTTDHELASLARSEEVMVRAAVAERIETPLTAQLKLVYDEAASVRAALARNQRTDMPLEMRQDLAKDTAPEVLLALVRNPAVPDTIVVKLSRSRQRHIAAAARKRLS
ncbi:MAG: hypothetical protein WDZ57_03040, partial [Demequina sp.]